MILIITMIIVILIAKTIILLIIIMIITMIIMIMIILMIMVTLILLIIIVIIIIIIIGQTPWMLFIEDRSTNGRRLTGRFPKVQVSFLPCSLLSSQSYSFPYGQLSNGHVLKVLPDPGALNSRMHIFPEMNDGFTMV